MSEAAPTYCLLPGAGSAGLTWSGIEEKVNTLLLPIPDVSTVSEMANELLPIIHDVNGPVVLVGASLGAMVALEIAHRTNVGALLLLASGFGIEVSPRLLEWVSKNPPDLFLKMARISVMNGDDETAVELIIRDFESRGQPTVLNHLTALGNYHPVPLEDPPPTFVIWGMLDTSVPLEAHVELASRCAGALIPLAQAKHMPFFEQPEQTVRWMKVAHSLSRAN
jgi:pimeloyl-ACP methyl ester carboxylesterase